MKKIAILLSLFMFSCEGMNTENSGCLEQNTKLRVSEAPLIDNLDDYYDITDDSISCIQNSAGTEILEHRTENNNINHSRICCRTNFMNIYFIGLGAILISLTNLGLPECYDDETCNLYKALNFCGFFEILMGLFFDFDRM